MSGGEYRYAYKKVLDFIDDLKDVEPVDPEYSDQRLRALFVAHLHKVAEAMKAIEWNDSHDGDRTEKQKILACLNPGLDRAFLKWKKG